MMQVKIDNVIMPLSPKTSTAKDDGSPINQMKNLKQSLLIDDFRSAVTFF
jgi:hypothetical protein